MANIDMQDIVQVQEGGGVPAITWKVMKPDGDLTGYDYMAVYLSEVMLWYIAGDAKFYGGTVKDTSQMLRYLQSPEVERVHRNTQAWSQISRD